MFLLKYKTNLVLFLMLGFVSFCKENSAQVQLRIMSYNLNDYASNDSRNDDFTGVISPIDPDIFIGIKLTSSSKSSGFRTNKEEEEIILRFSMLTAFQAEFMFYGLQTAKFAKNKELTPIK